MMTPGTSIIFNADRSGNVHSFGGDKPEQPIEAVRFKMPPYFEFQSPELIETAAEFLKAGALKTPYDFCHFETQYKLDSSDLLLNMRVETKLEADHYLLRISGKQDKNSEYKSLDFSFKIFLNGEDYKFFASDDVQESMSKLQKFDIERWAIQAFLACAMAVNMTQFEQTEIVASEKLQKATARRGKPPIKPYILVSLRPEYRAALNDGKGGQKIPHWRRGHLRHLSSGAIVPVSPCMVNWRGDVIEPKEYRLKTNNEGK